MISSLAQHNTNTLTYAVNLLHNGIWPLTAKGSY